MKALIFDVDGTLAETEELHRRAFNLAFADHGWEWHWDAARYRRLLTTTGGKERIARYAQEIGAGSVDVVALHRAKTQHFAHLMAGGIPLRPGIAQLMGEARREGLALAVATTTSPENVEALCQACFGQSATLVFDVIAAGDMVPRKKPAPDVYLLALKKLGLGGEEALAFEDSANGVNAARAAGLPVVLSRGTYTLQEQDVGASLTLGCFAEINGLRDLRDRMRERV